MYREIHEGSQVTGGQAVMQALLDNQVEVIFGYPGGAIMPIYHDLTRYVNRIRHILTRHEQGAIHMAEGYARMTHKPGVVFATSGPGALNTFTGLRDAFMDSTPLVVITGQVASRFIGTEAFQEAPVTQAAEPLTKASILVRSPHEIVPAIDRAFAIARSGRPGPVIVDIPKDFQLANTVFSHFIPNGEYAEPSLNPERIKLLQDTAELLNVSQRPYIIAGNGIHISGAHSNLVAIAEKTGIPIATTLQGLSAIPSDHELSVGMIGMHGRLGANTQINRAQTIFAIGCRFDDRVTGTEIGRFAPQARIVHVDIDPKQLGKVLKPEDRPDQILINLDAKNALSSLLNQLNPGNHSEWLSQFMKMDAEEDAAVTNNVLSANTPDYKMAEVINKLSKLTYGEAVIVADVGQHQMVAAQRYHFALPNSFITSGGMGTMGYALPGAIGAKIGALERKVIAVIGDGSFQMTEQELGVIMQEKLSIGIIILNNNYLGMVRQWQDKFHGGNHSFVDMQNPNFARLAGAYGIPAERVRRPMGVSGAVIECLSSAGIPIDRVTHQGDVNRALQRMISAKGPYLLEIQVERNENVFPMMPPGAAVNEMVLS